MAIINRANGTTYQLGIDGKKILALLDDRIQVNSDSDKLHEDKDKNQEEYFWGDFWSDRSDIYIMIGNGFDLECGLPTSYTDYLNFIKAANMVSSGTSCEALPINSTIKDKLLDPNCNISFWQKMANNYWIHHFNNVFRRCRSQERYKNPPAMRVRINSYTTKRFFDLLLKGCLGVNATMIGESYKD